MPKVVDHEERRAEIVRAFLDLATKTGLESVSLRGVAGHANVSLRQVQYYFGSKETLVMSGLHYLENNSYQRVDQRLLCCDEESGALETIGAIFDEALPIDEKSKQFHQLWTSYAMLSLTQGCSSDQSLLGGTNRLQQRLERLLNQGVVSGELRGDIQVANEAVLLLGLINGLGTAVLLEQQSAEKAKEVFLYQLGKLKNGTCYMHSL